MKLDIRHNECFVRSMAKYIFERDWEKRKSQRGPAQYCDLVERESLGEWIIEQGLGYESYTQVETRVLPEGEAGASSSKAVENKRDLVGESNSDQYVVRFPNTEIGSLIWGVKDSPPANTPQLTWRMGHLK